MAGRRRSAVLAQPREGQHEGRDPDQPGARSCGLDSAPQMNALAVEEKVGASDFLFNENRELSI
jgi:hypothetical protein